MTAVDYRVGRQERSRPAGDPPPGTRHEAGSRGTGVYIPGHLWAAPLGAAFEDDGPPGAGVWVGAVCVVLAALDVDDVAALAIAAPPAASEPTTVRVARAVAIRCRMFRSLPFFGDQRVNS